MRTRRIRLGALPTSLLAGACALAAVGCGTTVSGHVPASTDAGQQGLRAPDGAETGSKELPGNRADPGGGSANAPSVAPTGEAAMGPPGAPGALGAPGQAPGVSPPDRRASSSVIEIGVFDQDNPSSAISAVGGEGSVGVSSADVVRALVDYFNAHGGIADRKIKLVEYTLKTTATDWRVDAQAACAKFTEDNDVQVAVSTVGGGVFLDSYEACLQKAGVPNVQYGSAGGKQSFEQFRTMFSSVFPSVDDAVANMMIGLANAKYLTRQSKIGVVIENCSYDSFAHKHTVEPLAKRLGLNIIRTQTVDCLNGYGDVGTFAAQVQSAVLPFRSAGVDRVMFVSTWEALALVFFEKQAESQAYAVNYAITSLAQIAVNASNFSTTSLARMQGVGWWPESDVTSPPVTAPMARCRAMAAAQGLDTGPSANGVVINWICAPFLLLEAALKRVQGNHSSQALVTAFEGLGGGFASSVTIRGEASLTPIRHHAVVTYQRFLYDRSCSCFRYA